MWFMCRYNNIVIKMFLFSVILADITVLVNETVDLPCDLTSRNLGDAAIIVLWYRGNEPAPFYRYVLYFLF